MRKPLFFALFILLSLTVQAKENTFIETYLELRGSEEGGLFKRFDQKELRRMAGRVRQQGNTEAERQKFLRERALFEQVERIGVVMDLDEDKRISPFRVDDLLRPYEELFTVRVSGMKMMAAGMLVRGKVKELILLMDTDEGTEAVEAAVLFVDLLFKKPIDLSDYMDDPANLGTLFSLNGTEGEESRALFKFDYSHTRSEDPGMIRGYNDSTPFSLEVVQVDGKYGIKRMPDFGGEYLIRPTYSEEPVIYGTNPGNTYVLVRHWADREDCMLYDKFGFTVAHGDEISPVYVIGDAAEVAVFIIRDATGYSLYECPETYALRQDGSLDGGDFALRPHIERRFWECRSIVPTADGRLECVLEDGTREYVPIRKSNT